MGISDLAGIAPGINRVAAARRVNPNVVRIQFSDICRDKGFEFGFQWLQKEVAKLDATPKPVENPYPAMVAKVANNKQLTWAEMNSHIEWRKPDEVLEIISRQLDYNGSSYKFLQEHIIILAASMVVKINAYIELAKTVAIAEPHSEAWFQEVELLVRNEVHKIKITVPDWLKPEAMQSGKSYDWAADMVHGDNWKRNMERLATAIAVLRDNYKAIYECLAAKEVRRQLRVWKQDHPEG